MKGNGFILWKRTDWGEEGTSWGEEGNGWGEEGTDWGKGEEW